MCVYTVGILEIESAKTALLVTPDPPAFYISDIV